MQPMVGNSSQDVAGEDGSGQGEGKREILTQPDQRFLVFRPHGIACSPRTVLGSLTISCGLLLFKGNTILFRFDVGEVESRHVLEVLNGMERTMLRSVSDQCSSL